MTLFLCFSADFCYSYDKLKQNIPSFKHVLTLSANEGNTYSNVCDMLLPVVVGVREMKTGMKQGRLISDIATVSDEALCIAILENSWDKWVHLYENKDDSSDNENEDEENRSVPNSKWTYDGRGAGAKKYLGWNRDGIDRFNIITTLVKEDREKQMRSTFEHDFKNNNRYAKVQKQKKKAMDLNPVQVYDDL